MRQFQRPQVQKQRCHIQKKVSQTSNIEPVVFRIFRLLRHLVIVIGIDQTVETEVWGGNIAVRLSSESMEENVEELLVNFSYIKQ